MINYYRKIKLKKDYEIWAYMLIGMIIYKISTELGYYYILSKNSSVYIMNFNVLKYLVGCVWCFMLFFFIRHKRKRVSTFMLYLLFISQVIPLTCIYALSDQSSLYYNLICFSILMVELFVGWSHKSIKTKINIKFNILRILPHIFVLTLIFFLVYIYVNNGIPTTIAFNIFRVYELRSSGWFQIGKYGSYLLSWLVLTIIPYLAAFYFEKKKYFYSFVLFFIVFLIYLYTGHKSFLFSIPLILVCSIWTRRDNAYKELWFVFCVLFSLIVVIAIISDNKLFDTAYSLIGRRLTVVSAINKYFYFDFFSENQKLGMAGVFPRWLVPVTNPYEGKVIGKIIGDIYWNAPEMNSNTGFLAEGFVRFGIVGIFVEMFIYAWILKLEDAMAANAGYALTVSAFVYPMLMLTDGFLLDAIVIGHFTFIVIIALIYKYFVPNRKGYAIIQYEH